MLAFATALPIALESLLPHGAVVPWAIGWVTVCLVLLALFGRDTVLARRKERAEAAQGYTTALGTARSRADLYLLDRQNFHVLSKPFEARPANIRAAASDRARAAQEDGSDQAL